MPGGRAIRHRPDRRRKPNATLHGSNQHDSRTVEWQSSDELFVRLQRSLFRSKFALKKENYVCCGLVLAPPRKSFVSCELEGDWLPGLLALIMEKEMEEKSYDVVVVGGAFSGAATALLLRREAPDLRIAVIQRSRHFDRKVGEATTEVSGCFLTKRLAVTHHLCHHHVVKNGLRFWFARESEDAFDRCGELGAFYQVRLPSYQETGKCLTSMCSLGDRSRR